uniref:MBL fold metallo-hydrolase n=1 Tax=candidate division WOR-3 bacterium TaxID=2052148 RepID=A0A7C3J6R6_UNCW3
MMKIVWYGHASFQLNIENKKIIFDPYQKDGYGSSFRYKGNFEDPDIVLISHNHSDHNFRDFKNSPKIIDREGIYDFGEIKIESVKTFHDQEKGKKRGENLIFIVHTEKGKIIHFGDLGHLPSPETFKKLSDPYAIMIPVGGYFTIDHNDAKKIIENISPLFVFPMHYKTEFIDFPIEPVSKFLEDIPNYKIKRKDLFDDSLEELENSIYLLSIA